MAAIDPRQLETIAAFLEKSRDYLDIQNTIRLYWPHRPAHARGHERTSRTPERRAARRSGDLTATPPCACHPAP